MRREDLGDGYARLSRGVFVILVVELAIVAEAEHDDLLASFAGGKLETPEVRWFWSELVGSQEAGMSVQDLEGYDEMMQKLLNSVPPALRLAGIPPEQRLAGLAPEQRLADLDRDHQALALPLEVLRLLPEDYIRSLSVETQAEIQRRLGRGGA